MEQCPAAAPAHGDIAGAAGVLRELLSRVQRGELAAPGRRGKAVTARLEAALMGLDVAAGKAPAHRG